MADRDALARTITSVVNQVLQSVETNKQWDPEAVVVFNHAMDQVVQAYSPAPRDTDARRIAQENLRRAIDNVPIRLSLPLDGRKIPVTAMCRIEAFGSCVAKSDGPDSDLDLSVDVCFETADGDYFTMRDAPPKWHGTLLQKLSCLIEDGGVSRGRMERILHARVPVVKFVEAQSGVACDLCVHNVSGVFKSRVMREIARIDPRFSELVRLAKAWARCHRLNDPSRNTFNSYALSLMVLYHLQTVQPPVMPALEVVLFGERPLQYGVDPDPGYDFAMLRSKCKDLVRFGAPNKSTSGELFLSFLARFMALTQAWVSGSAENVRIDTFHGALGHRSFDLDYIIMVEDPFDNTDNAARTIGTWSRPRGGGGGSHERVAECFLKAVLASERLSSTACVKNLLRELFGKGVANINFVGEEGADRRRKGRGQSASAPAGDGDAQEPAQAAARVRRGRAGRGAGGRKPLEAGSGGDGAGRGRGRGRVLAIGGGALPEMALGAQDLATVQEDGQAPDGQLDARDAHEATPIVHMRDAFVDIAPKSGVAHACAALPRVSAQRCHLHAVPIWTPGKLALRARRVSVSLLRHVPMTPRSCMLLM